MTETTTQSGDSWDVLLKSAVLFVRLLQATAGGFAVVFVAGALVGGMNVLAFVMIAVFAGVLLLVILVLEFVAVRGLKGWAE